MECKKNNVIPKFWEFKVTNRHLYNPLVYNKCQIKLLVEEIKAKQKRIKILENDNKKIPEELQGTLSIPLYKIYLLLVSNF